MSLPERLERVRSALYLPASNPRALTKVRTLAADMVILDLEDSVADQAKAAARAAVVAAAGEGGWPGLLAVRTNAVDSVHIDDDLAALENLQGIDLIVVPKIEVAAAVAQVRARVPLPVLAMIESPLGVFAARAIAATEGVAGLIAGTNDLAATLRLPPGVGRESMSLALQTIVLAAREAGVIALDGVWNRLDDADGFAADCVAGRALGFDGKSLIHPSQIEPANRLFGPSAEEIEEAKALIAAATGGAERFRGRMVETLHVEAARRLLARAPG